MSRLGLLLPVPLLLLAGLSGDLLERAREKTGVPLSAAQVPLGGFEPVAVNLLWLRAEALIEENRLPEALTAIRLATELQPRVASAWGLHAFILAWWTSESAADPEEQWRWVREALSILDRGLALNPGSPPILRTAGSLYMNRIANQPELRRVAERELGRPPEAAALEVYRELELAAPSDLSTESRADAARRLGDVFLDRGERGKARRAYEEALESYLAIPPGPRLTEVQSKLDTLGDG